MYEDIRKPRLLKNIPMLLIRALPSIYYYCKFAGNRVPERVSRIYHTHLDYLAQAIALFGERTQLGDLPRLSRSVAELKGKPASELSNHLEKLTIELSGVCTTHQKEIHRALQELRPALIDIYRQSAERITVLTVDNNNEPEKVDKLLSTLRNFCYYPAEKTAVSSSDYPQRIVKADFVVFASTYPPEIHSLMEAMQTYRKPVLALAAVEKEAQLDKQSIRHGSQLQRAGFPVLFRIFTPIRLFTSIDKIYMKFHLCPQNTG